MDYRDPNGKRRTTRKMGLGGLVREIGNLEAVWRTNAVCKSGDITAKGKTRGLPARNAVVEGIAARRFDTNKDKLFFFWSAEYQRQLIPEGLRRVTVPTALERQGDDACAWSDTSHRAEMEYILIWDIK